MSACGVPVDLSVFFSVSVTFCLLVVFSVVCLYIVSLVGRLVCGAFLVHCGYGFVVACSCGPTALSLVVFIRRLSLSFAGWRFSSAAIVILACHFVSCLPPVVSVLRLFIPLLLCSVSFSGPRDLRFPFCNSRSLFFARFLVVHQ